MRHIRRIGTHHSHIRHVNARPMRHTPCTNCSRTLVQLLVYAPAYAYGMLLQVRVHAPRQCSYDYCCRLLFDASTTSAV
eukprot:2728478-Rhodomonas_salina.2